MSLSGSSSSEECDIYIKTTTLILTCCWTAQSWQRLKRSEQWLVLIGRYFREAPHPTWGSSGKSFQVRTLSFRREISRKNSSIPLPPRSLSRHQQTYLWLHTYWGLGRGISQVNMAPRLVFLVEHTRYDLRPHNYPRWPGIQWLISLGSCEGSFG